MGLSVHVCVRQLPPTCDLRSNCIVRDCLGYPQTPAGRGALTYIGNLCWRVPKWTWKFSSLMVQMGLWVHVCVRHLPPTCDLRSNCMAGDCLGCPQPLAGRGALTYIGNLCWRVPEWNWGGLWALWSNVPLVARLRASAPAHKWLKVKLIRGGFPGIPSAARRPRCRKLHREPMLTRPWMELGGLWPFWSKWASGCMFACVSSRPQVTSSQTASCGILLHPPSPPRAALH